MSLKEQVVVVAGGTGNIGTHVVRSLLVAGARVVVPSRSAEKLADLRRYLALRTDERLLTRLTTSVGDFGGKGGEGGVENQIVDTVGAPDAVVSALGRFVPAESLLDADPALLRAALDDYPMAHFRVARALLPKMTRGTFVFINGPLAFDPWESSGAHLVSVATAAQHMLFRALSQEVGGSDRAVVELVVHTFVRDRETQPGSTLPVEAVGAYVGHLLERAPSSVHGSSVRLDSTEVLEAAGIDLAEILGATEMA
jgi:3-oxoacyl-[acyl-carrier protein] reductase